MRMEQIRDKVLAVLKDIVPDADLGNVDPDQSFHDQYEVDSVDFLRFVMGIERELGVDIAELDYPKLSTLGGCLSYLGSKL